jgi:DNA-binding winged helix-turn-helix (wHTH) protein
MEELSREQLEEQVELLRQQLGALTGSSQELGILMSLKHGMTLRLATILYILVKRAPAAISRATLHQLVYGDRADGGPEPKIFNNYISRLRGVLQRVGASSKLNGDIETVWHAGFRASPQLVKWIDKLFTDNIPQEK